MADPRPPLPHHFPVHRRSEGGFKGQQEEARLSTSKILAVVTMLPLGAGLLALAGTTLVGTLIGLAVATPLFILFSPVLVPAALVLAFAVTAFLASGALGLTGATSLSWVTKYLRQARQQMPERLDQAKKRMQDMAAYAGQRTTKEAGQEIQKGEQEGK